MEFRDNYEHLDDSVEYILENILMNPSKDEDFTKLRNDFNGILLNICQCCECDSKCPHGVNYELKNGQLVLSDERKCKDLIYECNEACSCGEKCSNKLVQFGPCNDLKIINFEAKGYGVISQRPLQKGTFICEYAGEVLTKQEAIQRDHANREQKTMNYIFCLNEMCLEGNGKIQTFIDPSRKGNIGRYLNHSCEPNCDILSVRINSVIPKLAIFTVRDIVAGEELCFSYGEINEASSNKPCVCKSKQCKKILPNISFK